MHCSNCGAPLQEGSAFCGRCGQRVDVQATTVIVGREQVSVSNEYDQDDIEPISPYTPTNDVQESSGIDSASDEYKPASISQRVSDAASLVQGRVSETAQSVRRAIDSAGVKDRVSDAARSLQNAVDAATSGKPRREPKPVDTNKSSSRQDYLSRTDLWTWLKKDERRQLFYTEERDLLSEDEYMELVSQRLIQNEVPAAIEQKTIRWDNSDAKTLTYFVRPSSTAVNPLTCLLQFSNVGRFSFVEQKTFLAPPNLPPYPESKLPIPGKERLGLLFYGGLCALAGLLTLRPFGSFGVLLLIVGCVMMAVGYPALQKIKEVNEHNKRCDEQLAAYNKAWKDWEDTVFLHSFQESTNGKITRIYQAVFESIKQVNAEQFKDVEPTDERVDTSMAEMRQQISSLKESYR